MKKEENAMVYTTDYQSPLGTIFLAADEKVLPVCGWKEKYYAAQIKKRMQAGKNAGVEGCRTLAGYLFSGKRAGFYAGASSGGNRISICGVGDSAQDSLRPDDHLR